MLHRWELVVRILERGDQKSLLDSLIDVQIVTLSYIADLCTDFDKSGHVHTLTHNKGIF